ncbi:MAG: hypothetical protein AAGA85_12315 [Bacteroidota bacterium]
MRRELIVAAMLVLVSSNVGWSQNAFDKMTNEKMQKILYREASDVQGELGNWQFQIRERPMMILTDVNANRMRIMTPIIEEGELKKDQYKIMLEANFDRALDAKYAIYSEVVWSVFTHPLAELTVEQFKSAMGQVATLADNFGGSYNSTDLLFGGGN